MCAENNQSQRLSARQARFNGQVYTFTQRGQVSDVGFIRVNGRTVSGWRGNMTGNFHARGQNANVLESMSSSESSSQESASL